VNELPTTLRRSGQTEASAQKRQKRFRLNLWVSDYGVTWTLIATLAPFS